MKLSALVLAITLLVSPLYGADSAKQIFDAAMQSLQSGDYTQAEAGFRKVLELDPRNIGAMANLGVVYSHTHRYAKAIETYQRVLRISPQQRQVELDLGLAYLKQEDYSLAAPYFRRLHDRYPNDRQAAMLLGTCLVFSGHARDGLTLLKPLAEKAIRIPPRCIFWVSGTHARDKRRLPARYSPSCFRALPLPHRRIFCWGRPITTPPNSSNRRARSKR